MAFKVQDVEPSGIGRSVNIALKDTRTDQSISVVVWPDSTEDDLRYLLTRAVFELRGMGQSIGGGQHEWLM